MKTITNLEFLQKHSYCIKNMDENDAIQFILKQSISNFCFKYMKKRAQMLISKGYSLKKRPLKAVVTLEIEIDEDIVKKYPNFIFNYENERDFLINQISYLEHNSKIEECEVFKNLHPAFNNPNYNYDLYDDGYKQIVKNVVFQ
ncbi:hypothetical protein ACOTVS_10535 [Aliarcobacter butzleri]